MSRLTRISAIVALFLVLPGAMEGLENAIQLIGSGHLAHSGESSDSLPQPTSEHGCSGTLHYCSCCPPASAVLIAARDLARLDVAVVRSVEAPYRATSYDPPTLERPPQS